MVQPCTVYKNAICNTALAILRLSGGHKPLHIIVLNACLVPTLCFRRLLNFKPLSSLGLHQAVLSGMGIAERSSEADPAGRGTMDWSTMRHQRGSAELAAASPVAETVAALARLADVHAESTTRRLHKRTKGSWYVMTAKGDVGPLGNRELLAAAKRGDIDPGTELKHGMPGHTILAGQVRGLFSRRGRFAGTVPQGARDKAAADAQVTSA